MNSNNQFTQILSFATFTLWTCLSMGADRFESRRHKLVDDIIRPAGVSDERVLGSIRETKRHEFISPKYAEQAYFDRSLPIGDQQTISSPFIVALMTQLLETVASDKVLEIGTGSGYQAAVLSPLVSHVYTIEIVDDLGRHAERVLKRLDYKNVSVRVGDGFLGWPEAAPFDKIIVTCSPEKVPQPLVAQLRDGGRIVIPVGERFQQMLYVLEKQGGEMKQVSMLPTLFVPMTGAAEQAREKQPDGSAPGLINGSFESSGENDFIDGWYYGRSVTLMNDDSAAKGQRYVRFENKVPGTPTHLMQGFALDGKRVSRLRLTAFARTKDMKAGLIPDELPVVSLAFYDAQRSEVAVHWLGPFRNEENWLKEERVFVVPPATQEAIVRIGLFGATGQVDFDEISVEAIR